MEVGIKDTHEMFEDANVGLWDFISKVSYLRTMVHPLMGT